MNDQRLDRMRRRVATWPGVTVTEGGADADPPFEGTVFRVAGTAFAGLRADGLLDVSVDASLRDHLLTEGRADRHPTAPTAERVTYRVAGPADVTGAMWLLRVAHLVCCHRVGGSDALPVDARRTARLLRLSPELTRLAVGRDAADAPG